MKYKIIITENKLERVAINWLNDNYGDLEPYETEKYPNQVFYRKGKEIIFSYNKKPEQVFVNYEEVWSFFKSFLSMENEQIRDLIKVWMEERYNLRVTTTPLVLRSASTLWRNVTKEHNYWT
jgi:hypothetical protein